MLSQVPCAQRSTTIEGTVGSTYRVGRVSICDGTEWRAVCDTDWDINDARVVCRELGFPPEGMTVCVCVCVPLEASFTTDPLKELCLVEAPVLV